MKKTVLAIVLAGAFSAASAQNVSLQGAPDVKPTGTAGLSATAAPAAGAVASAQVFQGSVTGNGSALAPGLVNPFSGKTLSLEDTQRELEASRLHTQRLEEQLKQTNLVEELKTLPARKAVETAQASTAVAKEQAMQKEIQAAMTAPKGAAPVPTPAASTNASSSAKPKADRKAAAKPAQAESTSATPAKAVSAAPVAAPRAPVLVSIVAVGNKRSAVLEYNGATLVSADGDMTPFGPLKVLDESSVDLGGKALRVHSSTLARFVVSDQGQAAPSGQNGTFLVAGTSPSNMPPGAASSNTPTLPLPPGVGQFSAGAQPASGARSTLPPLQLPPGVNVVPSR